MNALAEWSGSWEDLSFQWTGKWDGPSFVVMAIFAMVCLSLLLVTIRLVRPYLGLFRRLRLSRRRDAIRARR
jgi:hypothetical protein